jgi:hypothetical protein
MTITQRKARGAEIPHKAQKVFFFYDSQDADEKDSLIADLLSMDAGMDCVVSYLETRDDIDTETLRNELQEHQALALWVTARLLDSMANGDIPEEYRLAKELGVPILPIVEYGELFPRFTEIAGAIHGIARSDAEYRAKLKARLLELAAEGSGLSALSAAEQLAGIYEEGIGTGINYTKALEWREKVVALGEQLYGKENPRTAAAYSDIAMVYVSQRDYPRALEWLHKALAVYEKILGKEHPLVAAAYNIIALIYKEQGDYPRSLEWFQKTLAVYECLAAADPDKYGKDAETTRTAIETLKKEHMSQDL